MIAQLATETRYYARYFGDPDSRLFWSEGQLHCGLLPKRAMLTQKLQRTGLLSNLVQEKFLLPFDSPENEFEAFTQVLRIHDVPRFTYSYEWPSAMWKAAAIHVLRLLEYLAQHTLTLRNPHPWNVLFDGHQPVYINPGSISPLDQDTFTRSCDKISRFFINPLRLHVAGHSHIARRLAHDIHDGASQEDLQGIGLEPWPEPTTANLSDLIRRVEELAIPDPPTMWNNYYTPWRFENGRSWAVKQQELEQLITENGIRQMTDVAGNTGHYARVAAGLGVECISIDIDEVHASRLFHALQSDPPASKIVPAMMDFTNPSPGYGVANDWFPSAIERLRSELVIAFAVQHHLYFGRHKLTFDEIGRGLAPFTTRFALIEFAPDTTGDLCSRWRPDEKDRYTANHFAAALANHFHEVRILPAPADDRQRILCERPRTGAAQ